MGSVQAEQDYGILPEESLGQELEAGDDLLFNLGNLDEEEQGLQAHTVLIGNIGLLLPRNQVCELIENAAVCSLPNTRAWFNGVTSVRGNMVPVFDLHELFSVESSTENRRLIAVGANETAVAFWVDDFPRLVGFADEDQTTIEPQIPALISEYARQYYMQEGQAWVEWDVESFFTALGERL